jgi:ABC-2 type transport system ATP-binding protein
MLIALDTPRAIIDSVGAEHVLEYATVGGESALTEDVLRSIAGVRSARARDGGYQLQVDALPRTMPALLTELQRRELHITELRTHSPTLEDVFVSLTGRHLRDE